MLPPLPRSISCALAALLGATLLLPGACSAPPSIPTWEEAIVSDDVPSDFSIAVTVLDPLDSPKPDSLPRARRPSRFIVEADRVLRAKEGLGHGDAWVTDDFFPKRTRQLTDEQMRRLWWDARDSGLLVLDHPARIGAWLKEPKDIDRTEYLVFFACGGQRRLLAIDADPPGDPDAAAVRKLINRLSELAWFKP